MSLSRRHFLGAAGAVSLASLTAIPLLQTTASSAPFLPYSDDSFFKSRVDHAPVDDARTRAFRAFMASHPDQKKWNYPKVNLKPDWAMSTHLSKPGDPVYRILNADGSPVTRKKQLSILSTQGVHMSDSLAATFPTGTQDRPFVIVDPLFGYTAMGADAVVDTGKKTIRTSSQGIMWHGSNGLDGRNPRANDSRNFTSRGRIPDAMTLRPDLIEAAVANDTGLGHVLHLFFVETRTADGVCHPMVGAENGKAGFGAEGERIRIAPSVDLAARGLTGPALAVARTLQQHGGYLGDNSGSNTKIKGPQGGYPGLTEDSLKGRVTWADFEVVPRGWQ